MNSINYDGWELKFFDEVDLKAYELNYRLSGRFDIILLY